VGAATALVFTNIQGGCCPVAIHQKGGLALNTAQYINVFNQITLSLVMIPASSLQWLIDAFYSI